MTIVVDDTLAGCLGWPTGTEPPARVLDRLWSLAAVAVAPTGWVYLVVCVVCCMYAIEALLFVVVRALVAFMDCFVVVLIVLVVRFDMCHLATLFTDFENFFRKRHYF